MEMGTVGGNFNTTLVFIYRTGILVDDVLFVYFNTTLVFIYQNSQSKFMLFKTHFNTTLVFIYPHP